MVPTPFVDQLAVKEIDLPTRFFLDLSEHFQDSFLLTAINQELSGNGKTANRGACHTAALASVRKHSTGDEKGD